MSWEVQFEEFLQKLSGYPEESLLEINKWFEKKLAEEKNNIEKRKICIGHIITIGRWVKEYDLKIPSLSPEYLKNEGAVEQKSNKVMTIINNFGNKIEEEKVQQRIENLTGKKIKFLEGKALSKDEKEKIRNHIKKIKGIIDNSNISERKANAIYIKINALEKEIDRFGTNLDSIMVGMVDIAIYSSTIVKVAKPVTKEVKEILKIVYNNKAKEMGVSLPEPEEKKLIENLAPEDD